jgi:hypothetical protein
MIFRLLRSTDAIARPVQGANICALRLGNNSGLGNDGDAQRSNPRAEGSSGLERQETTAARLSKRTSGK